MAFILGCAALMTMLLAMILLRALLKGEMRRRDNDVLFLDRDAEDAASAHVILVQDSPSPTKHMSSPFQPTQQRRCQRVPARRGGRRRWRQHRRSSTLQFNPNSQFDCGYMCALKLAKLPTERRKVALLRKMTAARVKHAYINDLSAANLKVREVVEASDQTLAAYVADVAHRQWASVIELEYALKELKVSAFLIVNEKLIKVGKDEAKGIIVLRNDHWTLMKIFSGKHSSTSTSPQIIRGGMQSGTWNWEESGQPSSSSRRQSDQYWDQSWSSGQYEWHQDRKAPDSNKQHPGQWSYPTTRQIKVKVHPTVRTDIEELTLKENSYMKIQALQRRLAGIMSVELWRLQIMAEGSLEPLPLFARVPDSVIVVDTWQRYPEINLVNLMHAQSSQQFILPISAKASDQEFRSQVAAIVGGEPTELGITDSHGAAWKHPTKFNAGEVVYVNKIVRGGMRMPSDHASRSRSVSPTRPFRSGAASSDQYHPQSQAAPAHDIVPADLASTAPSAPSTLQRADVQMQDPDHRVPSRDSSPSTGSSVGSERLHAQIEERTPPPAQPRNISKNVFEANNAIGRIRAPPNALVREVLADVESRICPHQPMWPIPTTAELWIDVVAIQIPARPMLDTIQPMDMRWGRWEVFQVPRHVPVISTRGVECVAVFPSQLSMRNAQIRLNNAAHDHTYYHLSATAPDIWVITVRRLPQEIRDMLLELEELRTIVGRGGMRDGWERQIDLIPIVHVLAHQPWCMITAYDEPHHTVQKMIEWAATTFTHDKNDVLVVIGDSCPHLTTAISDLNSTFVKVFLCGHADASEHLSIQQKDWLEANLVKQHKITETLDKKQSVQRGGVRSHRDRGQDPRSSMITWAQQKLEDHAPEFITPVSKLIIKAEGRCATALMHSRSSAQTRQIMVAAYKRHGVPLPHSAQPSADQAQAQGELEKHMSDIYNATTQQTVVTNHVLQMLNQQPSTHDFANLASMVHHNTSAQYAAIQTLRVDIERLSRRTVLWEDRHAPTPPLSPTVAHSQHEQEPQDSSAVQPMQIAVIDLEQEVSDEAIPAQQDVQAADQPPPQPLVPLHQPGGTQDDTQDQQDMETADYATQDHEQRMHDVNRQDEAFEPEHQNSDAVEPRVPTVLDLLSKDQSPHLGGQH